MTYKELIQGSLETTGGEEYEIEIDGKKKKVTEPTTHPIAFEHWLVNMSAIILNLVDKIIRQPRPSVTIGGVHESGDAIENPDFEDYMRAMIAGNFWVGLEIYNELRGFMDWLLEQEGPSYYDDYDDDDDILSLWFDYNTMAAKWNEFQNERGHEI